MTDNYFSLSDIHEGVLHTADKYMKKVLINAKRSFFRELKDKDPTGHPYYALESCQAVLTYEETGFLLADSETFEVGGQRIYLERSDLTDALLSLPKRQLEIILELVFLETPQEQLSAKFGISTRMIRKHRDSAFAKLRRHLTHEGKE